MSTETKTAAGFKVPCPHCGALEGLVVQVHDLAVTCRECDELVTRGDLLALVCDARKLLAWLEAASAPAR